MQQNWVKHFLIKIKAMRRAMLILVVIILSSCDPSYNCYVRNDSSSVMYLKTRPSIESLYDQKSTYYDSIISYKVREEGSVSVYKINSNGVFRIYGHIGLTPTFKELPFNYIEVIQGNDTTVLDGKQKILDGLKQENKNRKYFIQD